MTDNSPRASRALLLMHRLADYVQQLSIRSKLLLSGGIMASLFLVAVLVAQLQVRLLEERLARVVEGDSTLATAALEMEASLLGTESAVLGYLHDGNPVHLGRIRDDTNDFVRFLAGYEGLADTPAMKAFGQDARARFVRFRSLADGLVAARGEAALRAADANARLREAAGSADQLLAEAPPRGEKWDAAARMSASLRDMTQVTFSDVVTDTGATENEARRLMADVASQRDSYRRAGVSSRERALLEELDGQFAAATRQLSPILALSAGNQNSFAELVAIRQSMDRLLDDQIQVAAQDRVARMRENLTSLLRWIDVAQGGLLASGLLLVAFVGLSVYRGVTAPLERLRSDMAALARGESVPTDQVPPVGELGALAQSFREVVAARGEAEEETRRLTLGVEERVLARTRELERLNATLVRHGQEVEQLARTANLLQVAHDLSEAGQILSRNMRDLLATDEGAIYVVAPTAGRLDILASWGSSTFLESIHTDECWGLRRGGAHYAASEDEDVVCAHLREGGQQRPGLCLPMMAHGATLGLLWVCAPAHGLDVPDAWQSRVKRLSDELALALANVKLRETLRDQSVRDGLTGLYNRRYLEEALDREVRLGRREGRPFATVMFDVDHFKSYNDQYGHEGGDLLLRALGQMLRDAARTSDIVARYGGEEFTVVLHGAHATGAREWCERLRLRLQRLDVKAVGLQLPQVTVSMGLSMFPEDGLSPRELLRAADEALYEAKVNGRDRLVVASRPALGPVDVPGRAVAQAAADRRNPG